MTLDAVPRVDAVFGVASYFYATVGGSCTLLEAAATLPLAMDLDTLEVRPVGGALVAHEALAPLTALDREAARVFYAIPGVEDVRRQGRGQKVMFRIQGNNLSEDALEAVVACEIALRRQFPASSPLVEVRDRFDREPLHSSFWEELTIVHPDLNLSATTS